MPAATAFYVYAVLPADRTAPKVPAILPDTTIEAIPFHPLTLLVSQVPRALFEAADPAARTADPDWMAERITAHHEVVAAAAAAGPCLPLMFGALFSNPDLLAGWLVPRVATLQATLDQVATQTEWALSLHEEPDTLAAWVDRNDAAVASQKAAMASAGEGKAFLMTRRLTSLRAAARIGQIAETIRLVERTLAEAGVGVLAEAPRGGLPNWTVLLPNDRPNALSASMPVLRDRLPPGLSPRLSGPWPAYAFARRALHAERPDVLHAERPDVLHAEGPDV